ncbi:MAG TPA: radical SAM protein [Clostridia bacterium]|nr:radical SAM protein [Clostridia bacterium]
MPRQICIIIKPTPECNLRCRHCYHEEWGYSGDTMTFSILERTMSIILPYFDRVRFIWHGGEPLLMPLDFFKKAFEIQNKYTTVYNVKVSNNIQTNGTLINDDIANFFKEMGMGVGISFDGPCNDFLRQNTLDVLQGTELLNKKGVKYGFISVISSGNLDHLIETYDYFKKAGNNVKLNPVFQCGEAVYNKDIFFDYGYYVEKMKELFSYWIYDKDCNIVVEPFMEYFLMLLKNKKNSCAHSSCMFKWLGIQNDGSIYPCGRSFPQKYSLGNVYDYENINVAFRSDGYAEMLQYGIRRRNECRSSCNYFNYCEGGCNSDSLNEDRQPGLSCLSFTSLLEFARQELHKFMGNYENLNPYIRKMLIGTAF